MAVSYFCCQPILFFFFCDRCLVQIEELIDILIDSEGKVIVGENIPEESENVEVRNTN